MSELGWQAHRSRTSGAHTVRTMRTPPCTVRAHSGLTARHVIHRRAAGRLADQMSSPGDHLPVRVGPAFGIAPCGELAAKEFGGVGATRYYKVRVAMCTKWPPTRYTAQKIRCAAWGRRLFIGAEAGGAGDGEGRRVLRGLGSVGSVGSKGWRAGSSRQVATQAQGAVLGLPTARRCASSRCRLAPAPAPPGPTPPPSSATSSSADRCEQLH